MNHIDTYFSKAVRKEDAIPKTWLSGPLPKAASKRPVGRPRKTPYERPAPIASKQESTPLTPTSPPTQSAQIRGKYKNYNLKEKQAIVEEVKLYGLRVTARNHKMSHTTLQGWMKIDFANDQLTSRGQTPRSGRPISYPEEKEDMIVQWLHEQRGPVSMETICAYAHSVISPLLPEFKASRGWCKHFIKRHDFVLGTR